MAAVSVAQFLVSERLAVTIDNIRSHFRQRGEAVPDDLESAEGAKLVEVLVIHPDLLDDLQKDTQSAIGSYRKCLERAQKPQEKAACDRRAERHVCDTLNRIRDRNNDELPTDFLQAQWASFDCARV
jgi:hypothetical protein